MRREVPHTLRLVVVVLLAGLLSGAPANAGEQPGDPALVPAPGLDLPEPADPRPVAAPLDAEPVAPARVRRALQPMLNDPDLGPRVHAAVAGLDGEIVWKRGSGAATPASTTKVLTAVAALAALGPERRFSTSVVTTRQGIALVGGGDPLLAREPAAAEDDTYPLRADLATLAALTAGELLAADRRTVRLSYDDSLFTGPAENPAWREDYVDDGVVSPITALWVDKGRPQEGSGRVDDPSRAAAREFAGLLRGHGIQIRGRIQHRASPVGEAAEVLAAVDSPPVREIVEWFLTWSDNEATEVITRHIGLVRSGEGSFAGGIRGIVGTLEELGVRTQGLDIHGGSGLSRPNRIRPETLVDALRVAGDPSRPELATVLGALPVAGFTGSLTDRFDTAADVSPGRVRAKTGTLTGVTSLAGTAVGADGTPMLFVLMADRVPDGRDWWAQVAMDEAAGALAACACARQGGG